MAITSYQPKVYKKQGGNELVVASGGVLNIETGGVIKANGTQASAITPASVAHAFNSTFSDTELEAACNALGTKINSLITALQNAGITA